MLESDTNCWKEMRGYRSALHFLVLILFACSDPVQDEVDCSETDLAIAVVKIVYSDCGLSNGQITVEATGGKPPYLYVLDNGLSQTEALFTNVIPGFRNISVRDANNCSASTRTFMSSKEPFQVVAYTTPSGCETSQGTITVVPLGGVAPYKYQLGENNDNYQTTNVWSNLRSGQHSIWVEDANKCFFGFYVTVPSGISYASSIAPIIESTCAITSCHDGSIPPDFRVFTNIKANATQIKNLTANQTMPPDNPLTANEISLIACWVNDGALNN